MPSSGRFRAVPPPRHRIAGRLAVATASTYYLDCSRASAGSGTESSPWNSLATANSTTFEPGQRLLFKAGTTCTGQFVAHGSGAAGSPVQLGAYGTGARPIVDAAGAAGAVILLKDVEQWEVGGLELRNAATSPGYRSGVQTDHTSTTSSYDDIVIAGQLLRPRRSDRGRGHPGPGRRRDRPEHQCQDPARQHRHGRAEQPGLRQPSVE